MPTTDKIQIMQIRRTITLVALGLSLFVLMTSSCQLPNITKGKISVELIVDGEAREITIDAGSTVEDALNHIGIESDRFDKSEPPLYTVLRDGDQAQFINVDERGTVIARASEAKKGLS